MSRYGLQDPVIKDNHGQPVFWQAETGATVVKSDSTVLQPGVLYVGGAGDVNVRTRLGVDLLFEGVLAGSFLPVVVDMVYSTSTDATAMLILR